MIGNIIIGIALGIVCVSASAADPAAYNVRDYGAKGDGTNKDTAAIQAALDVCATNGGGRVFLPEGVYLTGSVVVGANTTLELEHAANLLGSPDIADYPLVNIRWEGEFRTGHRALISAEKARNMTITGPGSIFGPPISLSRLRNPRGPALIELTECTNVVLEDFATQYQQLWSIHTLFCENLTVTGLTIRSINVNGDGLDVDSCRDVVIEHCSIDTGDDAISLKSGRGLAALRLNRPTENVTIRDCSLSSSLYAAIGMGTEMSGGIRHVRVENCVMAGRQNCIFIKSRDGRGGFMEDFTFDNLSINNSPTLVAIDLMNKGIQATDPVPGDVEKWPSVKNFTFSHIRVNHVGELLAAKDIPAGRKLDGLTFSDITGTCGRGISLANVTNANFSEIHVTGFAGPLMNTENVTGNGLDLTAEK